MHSMGLHSALAIKRQRKRRDEQRRARERRYSQQSNESGLGESNSSFVSPRSSVRGRRRHQSSTAPDALVENKMMSSVGMLHIGVVFLVLGGFLLGSGLLPEDLTSWSQFTTNNWWNELTIAGGCAILLGVFLIVLNRYMARREEEDLTEYVQRQLTRSRSGHRLVRDVETGALTNKHTAAARMIGAMPAVAVRHERQKQQKRSKWSSSLALQTPLTGLTMIGAMPAVAVRHERRKQERRHKRPSQLGIQSPPGTGDSLDGGLGMGVGSPDALQSPPQRQLGRQEYYVCGKVSVLHVVVVSLLLGAILVIVGLVQLTPNADASQHRYLLLGGGGALLSLGILLAVVRCCVLPWRERRLPSASAASAASTTTGVLAAATYQGGGVEPSGSGSGSVRDGSRSRTNSATATNGQVARRASSFGVCTPTGAQRRRSLMELERGLPAGLPAGLPLHGVAVVGAPATATTLNGVPDADAEDAAEAERRAEIDNHINEMALNAPAELAATFPAALTPSPAPAAAEPTADRGVPADT